MTENTEARPNNLEYPDRQQHVEYEGEAFLAMLPAAVAGPIGFTAEHRKAALAVITDWQQRMQLGERVMIIRDAGRHDDVYGVMDDAGVALGPLRLVHNVFNQWDLRVEAGGATNDTTYKRQLTFGMSSVLEIQRFHQGSGVLIGEEQIRGWLADHRLNMLRPPEERPVNYFDRDMIQLLRLSTGRVPLEFLDLSMDEAAAIFDELFDGLPHEKAQFQLTRTFTVLKYLTGADDREQRRHLADAVLERLGANASFATNTDTRAMLRFVEVMRQEFNNDFGFDAMSRSNLLGQVYFLGRLFEHIAEQTNGQPEPLPPEAEPTLAERPAIRPLLIAGHQPTPLQLYEDNDYITKLRQTGVPSDELDLTALNMPMVAKHMMVVLLRSTGPAEQRTVLDNLEYLFNVTNPQARSEFYDNLCDRLGLAMPIAPDMSASLRAHLVTARLIAERAPELAKLPNGEPLQGHAATAAVMADLYRRRYELIKLRDKTARSGDVRPRYSRDTLTVQLPDEEMVKRAIERLDRKQMLGRMATALRALLTSRGEV